MPPALPSHRRLLRLGAVLLALAALTPQGVAAGGTEPAPGSQWKVHAMDARVLQPGKRPRGADGVRGMDINGDGLTDIVSGWEEAGETRVYLHPGHAKVREPWPAVTVAKPGGGPEDAVFADLDGDGNVDVITSSESGKLVISWSPPRDRLLDESAWTSAPIPAGDGKGWMYCLPMQVDGTGGIDLVCGAKGGGARNPGIVWFRSPADPRQLADWTMHVIDAAQDWVMSIDAGDIDGDRRDDVVVISRKLGARWMRHPGPGDALAQRWTVTGITTPAMNDLMLGSVTDFDGDGLLDVLGNCNHGGPAGIFRAANREGTKWDIHWIRGTAGNGYKAIVAADIDRDGKKDLLVTGGRKGPETITMWLSYRTSWKDPEWVSHPIALCGKPDEMEAFDFDGDGDIDFCTSDEHGLQVVWFENPTVAAKP